MAWEISLQEFVDGKIGWNAALAPVLRATGVASVRGTREKGAFAAKRGETA
jgi:hypothetical protein